MAHPQLSHMCRQVSENRFWLFASLFLVCVTCVFNSDGIWMTWFNIRPVECWTGCVYVARLSDIRSHIFPTHIRVVVQVSVLYFRRCVRTLFHIVVCWLLVTLEIATGRLPQWTAKSTWLLQCNCSGPNKGIPIYREWNFGGDILYRADRARGERGGEPGASERGACEGWARVLGPHAVISYCWPKG